MKKTIIVFLKGFAIIALGVFALCCLSMAEYLLFQGEINSSNAWEKKYNYEKQLIQQNKRIKDSLIYQTISTQRPMRFGWLHNRLLSDIAPETFTIVYFDFQLHVDHQPLIPYQKKELWEYTCTLFDGTDVCIDDGNGLGCSLKDRTYDKIKEICRDIKKQSSIDTNTDK